MVLIAPHGIEDERKYLHSKDCVIGPPTCPRVLEFNSALFEMNIFKADVSPAVLQTGRRNRKVMFQSPSEIRLRTTHLLHFDTNAYSFLNANAK